MCTGGQDESAVQGVVGVPVRGVVWIELIIRDVVVRHLEVRDDGL